MRIRYLRSCYAFSTSELADLVKRLLAEAIDKAGTATRGADGR